MAAELLEACGMASCWLRTALSLAARSRALPGGSLLAATSGRFRPPARRGVGYGFQLSPSRATLAGGCEGSSSELSGAVQPAPAPTGEEPEPGWARTEPVLSSFNIDVLVALLRQENAQDICVICVPPEMKYTDYFVIVTASSTRHLNAMVQYVLKMYKHMKKIYEPHSRIEGKEAEDWQCLDFGNMVVHFMLPETRELYELEKLWTLRSYDDQLTQLLPKPLPADFIYGVDNTAL
ncbi:mitochondrial assembly of ribosomal large subunit protein 1 [Rhinatrema bivittatum]|uniref:mitochondrial assembly of ribosomal large subunit protein 1 n=1 Tax=Rhinatrema bivittatum TaxID=194408 RepID=UPI001128F9A3|nr:mitochondrial assembly of ribosomal large subunit protein 1 [Rhinatrema bivittatum]